MEKVEKEVEKEVEKVEMKIGSNFCQIVLLLIHQQCPICYNTNNVSVQNY